MCLGTVLISVCLLLEALLYLRLVDLRGRIVDEFHLFLLLLLGLVHQLLQIVQLSLVFLHFVEQSSLIFLQSGDLLLLGIECLSESVIAGLQIAIFSFQSFPNFL